MKNVKMPLSGKRKCLPVNTKMGMGVKVFLEKAKEEFWDVILMTVSLPDTDRGYEIFKEIREAQPNVPFVGACHPEEVYMIARFMTGGMKQYIPRDANGDYLFLVYTQLESVVDAVRAEREQKLAERLREEIDSVRKLQESMIPRDLYCPDEYEIAYLDEVRDPTAGFDDFLHTCLGGKPVQPQQQQRRAQADRRLRARQIVWCTLCILALAFTCTW